MAKNFLYCEETDTRIFPDDVVIISSFSNVKFIAKQGWYMYNSVRKNGWYFVSLADKSVVPIDDVDIRDIVKDDKQAHNSGREFIPQPKEDKQELNYIQAGDILLYPNDMILISNYPNTNWVLKKGWYKLGTAQKTGWYVINIADRSIIPIEDIDLSTVSKAIDFGTSDYKPTLKDIDTTPAESNFIVIPGTNIRLYDGDVVKISGRPRIKWVVHTGWYIFNNSQNFGWYFVSIKDGEILPVSSIDLTLCTLVTVKTQGSELYDGKVVNYTRPFTIADAELLNRTFITVENIEQRDNIDTKKLINGRLVRCNDVGGVPVYYAWNAENKVWDKVDFGGSGSGIPEVVGTTEHPIILSELEPGLYRVIGTYKISRNYEMITLTGIHHLAFVSEDDNPNIKVITDTDITDYVVTGSDVTFVNIYATRKYVADNYATKIYVDNKIAALEAEISEIISGLDDRILEIVNDRLDEALNDISESYINSLFD